MSERRILLAVSTSRYSQHLLDHAIEEARGLKSAGHEVVFDVLTVIERAELERISRTVGDEGFLGLRPQREVLETLGAEHDRMADRRARQVQEAAAEAGFSVEMHSVEGTFVDEVLAWGRKLGSHTILITRAERPFISRILFGSEADKVAKLALRDGLGKVIIDEDDA